MATQMTDDDEKHANSRRMRGYAATFISPALYDAAEARGIDMTYFVKTKPISIPPGNLYDADGKLIGCIMTEDQAKNQYAKGPQEWSKITAAGEYAEITYDMHGTPYVKAWEPPPDTVIRWGSHAGYPTYMPLPRKQSEDHGRKMCAGKEIACLAGKNGKCVACVNDN